jgi:hypothetical protein
MYCKFNYDEFCIVEVKNILSLLPDDLLEELALETGVNKYSKKLQGEVIFKLLLHCILSHKDNSLRIMTSAYESIAFNLLNAPLNKRSICYSSISERLSSIDSLYFEKVYHKCVEIYGPLIEEKSNAIIRFDSTIVALSSKLLQIGYLLKGGDAAHVRQLKYTVGFSEIPTSIHFFQEQKYTSENAALKEAIIDYEPMKSNPIRVFDRGITSRKTHDELTEKNIPFISRINIKSKNIIHQENVIKNPIETSSLMIFEDSWIHLYSYKSVQAKHPVRCIKAESKETKEVFWFVTNVADLSAEEITNIYKRRWDIEVFFKFLKQELNFSHLLNRSENGARVVLYATLIAAILLLVYKKKNKLTGYKIMKLQFVQEIEKLIMLDIVIMCGGSAHKAIKLLNINSS